MLASASCVGKYVLLIVAILSQLLFPLWLRLCGVFAVEIGVEFDQQRISLVVFNSPSFRVLSIQIASVVMTSPHPKKEKEIPCLSLQRS